MAIKIRQALTADFKATENLTREAFWDLYKPGCDEHLLLHKIRSSDCYIPFLDLIMTERESIIGHVICTKAKVIDSFNKEHFVLCVGPFSIINNHQGKGFGTQLMEYCIVKSKEMGYDAMILFGNPDYYHRFGFTNALAFGISTKDGVNFDPFMALELRPGGLKGIQGRFFEDEVYTIDISELNEFEKQFPFKEKHITPTQLNI